jgi:hypothetical protein
MLARWASDMTSLREQMTLISNAARANEPASPAMPDAEQVEFLHAVLPANGPVYFAAYTEPDQPWRHIAARSVQQLAEHLTSYDGRGHDVYFAAASFAEERVIDRERKTRRRVRDNVAFVRACWLDIDVGEEKAASRKGYATLEAAKFALSDFSEKLGVTPTYVIGSGTGLHCWWAFNCELGLPEWDALAQLLERACDRAGLICDPARTKDAASVMRPVGAHHRKDRANLRRVRVLERGEVIDPAVFRAHALTLVTSCGAAATEAAPRPADRGLARWFHSLPTQRQSVVLNEACTAIPDNCWGTYDIWAKLIAACRGLRGLDEPAVLEILARHSARSPKWAADGWSVERLQAKFHSFHGASIQCLFEIADQHGWCTPMRDGSTPFQRHQRPEAERYLGDRFIYVASQHMYLDTATRLLISPAALDESQYHLTQELAVSPRHILKGSSRTVRVDAIGYHPGAATTYDEDGRKIANLYVPWIQEELEPTNEELDLWRWFIEDQLFGGPNDATARDYFLDSIAYPLQFPGRRVASVPLLIGTEGGTGKSTLMEGVPQLLFGPRNVSTATQAEIESSFNDWQAESQILCLPEIWIGGHRDAEKLANRLKDSVTNPVMRVHPKGLKGYSQPNRTTILATSNYENAVVLRDGDRRWGVHVTTARKMSPSDAARLHDFLKGPRGVPVLQQLFRRRDLSGFNAFGEPPLTDGKRLVIAASRSDVEDALVEAWTAAEFPFDRDLVVLEDVQGILEGKGLDASMRKIGDLLRRQPIGAVRLTSRPRLNTQRTVGNDPVGRRYEQRMVVWAVRNPTIWRMAGEKAINRHFEKGAHPGTRRRKTPAAAPATPTTTSSATATAALAAAGTPPSAPASTVSPSSTLSSGGKVVSA